MPGSGSNVIRSVAKPRSGPSAAMLVLETTRRHEQQRAARQRGRARRRNGAAEPEGRGQARSAGGPARAKDREVDDSRGSTPPLYKVLCARPGSRRSAVLVAGTPLAIFRGMGVDRSGASIGSDDEGPSVVEAAGRVRDAGERLLMKRLDLLRLEMAELARAGGFGLVGSYVAAVGLLLLAAGAVVWLDGFWPLEFALLAVGGGATLLGLLVLAVAVRRVSREETR